MPLPAPPAGFSAVRQPGVRGAVNTELEDAARAAGLLEPLHLAARLAQTREAGGRAPTWRVALAGSGVRLLVRPVRRGGLLGPWLGGTLLGPRRPLRELATNAALRAAGAPVPEPALALAWRRAGPLWNAAFATRLEEQALDAEAYLASRPEAARLRAALRATGRALRRFHDAGGRHPDLHVKNLLIRESAGGVEVIVIDLDRAWIEPRVDGAARMAELMRLYRSLLKRDLLQVLGTRGCLRVFHSYLDGDRELRKTLLARLGRERLRVALHALRYRRARP